MPSVHLADLNAAAPDDAAAVLRPCADVPRWVDALVAGRPYADVDDLVAHASALATTWTADEVDAALAHHPRIGERPAGGGAEAAMSRREQAAIDGADDAVAAAIAAGNRAYEERFGRVFLVRAAGRTQAEILDLLRTRLEHDDATEATVVADQLAQIAVLRLRGTVQP